MGYRQYRLLTTQAESICVDFTSRWNIDPNLLDIEVVGDFDDLKTISETLKKLAGKTGQLFVNCFWSVAPFAFSN